MRLPRPRLGVRTMMAMVAACALGIWAWLAYFDTVRLWRLAIRDPDDGPRRIEAINDAIVGKVPGVTRDLINAELAGIVRDRRLPWKVRYSAINGLAYNPTRSTDAVSALMGAFRDPSEEIRSPACNSLRQIVLTFGHVDLARWAEAVAALKAGLGDPDPRVRRWSACCLAEVGEGRAALPALVEALEGPGLSGRERLGLVWAIDGTGPEAEAALPAIRRVAEGRSPAWSRLDAADPAIRRDMAGPRLRAVVMLWDRGEVAPSLEALRKIAEDRDPLIAEDASVTLRWLQAGKKPEVPGGSP